MHVERGRRYVDLIIQELKESMPELVEALQIHRSIMKNVEAAKTVECPESTEEAIACNSRSHAVPNYQLAVSARKVKQLKARIHTLNLHNGKLHWTIDGLRERLAFLEASVKQPAKQPETPTDERRTILEEMMALAQEHPNRRRYSEAFYRFCYVFSTLSPKAYNFARQRLTLPWTVSVWRHFSGAVRAMKESVTDLSSIHSILESFLEGRNPHCERIVAALCVDAFAFRLFLRQVASISAIRDGLSQAQLRSLEHLLENRELIKAIEDFSEEEDCNEDENLEEMNHYAVTQNGHADTQIDDLFDSFSHCFMYVLIPLDSTIPSITIHLSPASNGTANKEHVATLDEITKICANYNIEVVYMSADGDAGWNVKFHEMFDLIAGLWDRPLFDIAETVQKLCLEEGIHMATTDLLHLLKRARGRYIDNTIVPLASQSEKTDYERVSQLLGGLAFVDKSQLGRMRDIYPIEMFSLRNVITLMHKQIFADAFYFLPFSILLIVIRVPFLRLDFRMQLLETVHLLFQQIYDEILAHITRAKSTVKEAEEEEELHEDAGERVVQRPTQDCRLVTFAELVALERIICTIVSYASALQTHPASLRTDALGTHQVEQKIGQARHGMDNRWTRILSSITQSLMRSLILDVDGMDMHSVRRLKVAGCSLDGTGDFYIEGFDQSLVARVMTHAVSEAARVADDFQESFQLVLSWLQIIADVMDARGQEIGKIWMPNPAANSGIMARLMKTNVSTVAV